MAEYTPIVRDETLRDGNQGEVPRSAFQAIRHILQSHQYFDMMALGWIYTNPADEEVAQYLRDNAAELQSRVDDFPDMNKAKFFVYTLMHRTDAKTGELKLTQDQKDMLEDMRKRTQPFGTVNVLSKARVKDLKDLGYADSSHCVRDLDQMLVRFHQANPVVKQELALEHFFTAWLESPGNHAHMINMISAVLKHNKHALVTTPDTDGAHTPEEIKHVITEVTEEVKRRVPSFSSRQFIIHPHKDRGHVPDETGTDREQSTANVLAALEAGAGGIDCCAGQMGERRGNVTLADVARVLNWPNKDEIAEYQEQFERSFGIMEGDKPVGGAESMCSVGGMHAARLWGEFMRQHSEGVTYDEFCSSPRGSYVSVPPDSFTPRQKIQVTLSPVAGSANVQHMLARLGMIQENKTDARIQHVLTEVKNGEHDDGENFRGYNNVNAMLLVANTFGLNKARRCNTSIDQNSLSISTDLKEQADIALQQAKKPWRESLRWLDDINITEARQVKMYRGRLSMEDGDPARPVQDSCQAVRLRFTPRQHSDEYFYAHGVGDTREAAVGEAVEKIIDWKMFEMEQLKNKYSSINSRNRGVGNNL